MLIKRLKLIDLTPAGYNPRLDLRPDDPRYEALAKSLDEFGLVQPLVWNSQTRSLVGGHQRLKVLLARGETHAEVVIVDLPPEKEKALNLALNKVGGDWDKLKLAALLDELVKVPDLELQVTGFRIQEVEQLLEDYGTSTGEPEDFDLAAAIADQGAPVTQPGDLLELGLHGEHRILCGDATSSRDVARVLGGHRAQLCFTDPPYGVSYDPAERRKRSKATASVQDRTRFSQLRNDDLTPQRYAMWFATVCDQLAEALAPGAAIYIWNAKRQFGLMGDLLRERKFHVASTIAWLKESPTFGFSDYSERMELCLYGWRLGAPHRWFGPRDESTVWEVRRDRTKQYGHPTQKALELAERALRNSSQPQDLVWDPFLGGGTTLIAAARMNRRCSGLEIDPKFCDVIVRRYIRLAGQGAVKAELARRYHVHGAK